MISPPSSPSLPAMPNTPPPPPVFASAPTGQKPGKKSTTASFLNSATVPTAAPGGKTLVGQ